MTSRGELMSSDKQCLCRIMGYCWSDSHVGDYSMGLNLHSL